MPEWQHGGHLWPDWLQDATASVNAELRAAGRCSAHDSDVNIPAAYVWHTAIGNEVPLCVRCCALWRSDAEAGRCEQPVKLEELSSR